MDGTRDSKTSDITVEILRDIRDGVKQTNVRLDRMGEGLNQRLDQTNARLDQMGEELNTRLDRTNARLDQTNDGLAGLRQEVEEGFRLMDQRFDNFLLGEHGKEHDELRRRVSHIEEHLGFSGKKPD